MKLLFWSILLNVFSSSFGFGQNIQGARLTALGNNGAAVKDIGGVEANPAGISEVQGTTLVMNYQSYFFIKDLHGEALGFVLPLNHYYLGLNLQRYGIDAYHQLKAGIIYTKQFGESLTIGVRANYHQLKVTNYGKAVSYTADIGAIYRFNARLLMGFYFNNLSNTPNSPDLRAVLTSKSLHAGIAYQQGTKLLLAITLNKPFKEPLTAAFGIDYKLMEELSLRTGISLNPVKQYFGLGFKLKKYFIDLATTYHPSFGYFPLITLGYVF